MAETKGSWSKTQEAMESQGSTTFLRLANDGDKAVVALLGAPYHRDICFNEKTNAYEPWDDAAKAAGRKKTSRYAMNVYVESLKGKPLGEIRVLEMNWNTMTTVIGLKDKYGQSKYLFEITRHGAANDTKTTYQILPDKEITAEMRALFGQPDPQRPDGWVEGSLPLLDLEEATKRTDDGGGGDATVTDDVKKDKDKGKGKAASAAPAPASANGAAGAAAHAPATQAATVPAGVAPPGAATALISKEAVGVIIEKLKPLDRDKGVAPFLAKFPYAKKVSEVRASDEVAAVALANQLAAPAAAEDPFA